MSDYVPLTEQEIKGMLADIGVESLDDLYEDVPKDLLLEELNIPEGKSQQEVLEILNSLAEKNTVYPVVFRGAGAYRHYIPSVVKALANRSEFVTAYTPYQAEISQGILQIIFEYQTMMCRLTGLDISNASMYNGASAAAEAVLMCCDRNRNKAIIIGKTHPDTKKTIKTYTDDKAIEIIDMESEDGSVDLAALKGALADDIACVYVEIPGFLGNIVDGETIGQIVHEAGAKFIIGFKPVALSVLKTPKEMGADIAVGDGQSLGLPLSFGGPYLGIMTCTEKLMRRMPGRIVGQTKDKEGRTAYVLTLQAREQHIKREKATSNICSNQALCALTSTIYLSALGKEGFKEVGYASASLAHYFADCLAEAGAKLGFKEEFFNEFVTVTPGKSYAIQDALAANNILSGLVLDNDQILWCATEMNSKQDIDRAVSIVRSVINA